jgi:hypothetical protein
MQNMTSRGDVPVKYILQEDTMRKSINSPVECPQINSCAGIILSNSCFVFLKDLEGRLDDLNGSYKTCP